ncbi:hypothetical protein BJX70DRAFT_381603 [Aspergillus crustosus]
MAADTTPPSEGNLPREKVFSIQIGTQLFRLSGASITSDGPSYFTRFFEEQLNQNSDNSNIRTLYIDRDPVTFQEIARHLQGYHVEPRDGTDFVKLFADAQFYSLPRLMSQLFESQIIIQIGDRHFQIPRDIFSGPGDSPNFFSLGFGIYFASPAEVFPGLDRRGLLRPPAIHPPNVPNRSGAIFAQLIHLLRGYPLHIENEAQRAELLRDCRYFHLRGLEQKLIPHHISFNPLRSRSEIILRLEDVRRSGIKLEATTENTAKVPVTVAYARPFADDTPHDLVLEIGEESTIIDTRTMRPRFLNLAKARVASLLQVIVDRRNSSKVQKPNKAPEHAVRVQIDSETDLTVDGEPVVDFDQSQLASEDSLGEPQAKRRRVEGSGTESISGSTSTSNSNPNPNGRGVWVVRNGHWRIQIRPGSTPEDSVEFVLVGVKLDVYSRERMRNRKQAFLGS